MTEALNDRDLRTLSKSLFLKFRYLDRDDLESAYNETVWKCLQTFDSTRNVKFTSYFYYRLRNVCLNLLRDYRKVLRSKGLGLPQSAYRELVLDIDEPHKTLLIQRYVDKYTLKEMSKMYNLTIEEIVIIVYNRLGLGLILSGTME
jgi:DNA-directed RNA polymerase specialized sigma24 family protein